MSDSLGLSQCNRQPMGFLALRTLPFNWSGLCFELLIGAPTELLWRAEVHVTHKILLSLFFFEGGSSTTVPLTIHYRTLIGIGMLGMLL